MTFLESILSFVDGYFRGIYISVILVLILKRIFENKEQQNNSLLIIKWIIIGYAIISVLRLIFGLVFNESEFLSFVNRATGPYYFSFIAITISSLVLPFFLLINRIGQKVWLILFLSVLMNLGWLFESFVIHVTSIHQDIVGVPNPSYESLLPYKREVDVIYKGVILGLVIFISNFIYQKKYRNV